MNLIELAQAIEAAKVRLGEYEAKLQAALGQVEAVKATFAQELASAEALVKEALNVYNEGKAALSSLFAQMHVHIGTPAGQATPNPTDVNLKQIALDAMKLRTR